MPPPDAFGMENWPLHGCIDIGQTGVAKYMIDESPTGDGCVGRANDLVP